MTTVRGESDDDLKWLANALKAFEKKHSAAKCIVYRYNPAAIRIKIVDSVFADMTKSERHDYAFGFLKKVPEDTVAQVSVLLCLAPGEHSLLDAEFSDPSPSML